MMNQQTNNFDARVNFNLSNQYWLQLSNHVPAYQNFIKKPVGVFWDIENCRIPRNVDTASLVETVRTLFPSHNLIENEFVVVCDVFGMNNHTITELNNMQVNIIHVCSFSKNACDEKLKQLMIRFVNTHGRNCAIFLFSSDINFAPVLTDLKNRLGIFVVLFHHQQVSPALLASSNLHFDYDILCSQVAFYANSFRNLEPPDQTMTNLVISNLPKNMDGTAIRSLVCRITNNSGGRIVSIDLENSEAFVSFRCKSDAIRCQQRIDNRCFQGSTLKTKLIYTNVNSLKYGPRNRHLNGNESTSHNAMTIMSKNRSQNDPPKAQKNISFEIVKKNTCGSCFDLNKKRSKYSNFILNEQILSVNISLEKLSKNLIHLFQNHPGKIPLNALPDCWLNNFGEEFNTETEPKILLEHLVCCCPNVVIESAEIDAQGRKFLVKHITHKLDSTRIEYPFNEKNNPKLQKIMDNIDELLMFPAHNTSTKFPSIKLQDLENIYNFNFSEDLNYRNHNCSSLLELLSLFKFKFNLYSYGDDYLLAFNFYNQLIRFISDLTNAFPNDQSSYLASDKFSRFKNFCQSDLDPSIYGVCFIQDIIDAIFDQKPLLSLIDPSHIRFIKQLFITYYPINHNNLVIDEFSKFIMGNLKKLLPSFPNFAIDFQMFHKNFKLSIENKFGVENLSYLHTGSLLMHHSNNTFELVFSEPDLITLSTEWQLIEVGERFIRIFQELFLLLNGPNSIKYNISVSIYQIFYHYQAQFKAIPTYGANDLSNLFERILAYFFKHAIHTDYCLVYDPKNIYLMKFSQEWKQDIIFNTFIFLLQNPWKENTYEDLKKYFFNRFSFFYGLSLFLEKSVQEVFNVSKVKNSNSIIRMNVLYEFVSMCLTVMLLHQKIIFPLHDSNNDNKYPGWTIDQIQNEFYDHYGISFDYWIQKSKCQINSCFQIDWLFEVDLQLVRVKNCDTFRNLDKTNIPFCNYCENSKFTSANTSENVSSFQQEFSNTFS